MRSKAEIYSIFGQIEATVAGAMVAEGKASRILQEHIPPTALFDEQGRKAFFAIVLPNKYLGEYEERVKKLYA